MKKGSPQYKNEKTNKVKNYLKLNVDEQQDAIIHKKKMLVCH